jgi:hypothetical protein
MPLQDFIKVARRILVKFLVAAEYDNCDVYGTENGELVRLLEQASFALEKRPKYNLGQLCYPANEEGQHTLNDSYHL